MLAVKRSLEDVILAPASAELQIKDKGLAFDRDPDRGVGRVRNVSYTSTTGFREELIGLPLNGRTVGIKCLGEVTATGTTYHATRVPNGA